MSKKSIQIGFDKNIINLAFVAVLLLVTLFASVLATVLFPMVIVWLVLLLALAIPTYKLNFTGVSRVLFDVMASLFTAVFTAYFTVLLGTVYAGAMYGCVSLFQRLLIHNPAELFIGILLAMPVYWLLRACQVPIRFAMAATPLGFFVITLADYIVYYCRGDELIAADILSAGTAMGVANNYQVSMMHPGVLLFVPYALYICACMRIKMTNKETHSLKEAGIRAVVTALATVLCVVSINSYGKNHNTEIYGCTPSIGNGIIINLFLTVDYLKVDEPEGYPGDEYFESAYANYSYNEPDEKVNVIVIMNEAFFDPDQRGLQLNMDPDPFFDSLTDNCIKGYALASVFGGRTANSEFEFMTGLTTAFLPQGSVVYSMYANDPLPSLAGFTSNMDYSTYGMHPYRASSWDRETIYSDMGFATTHFEDDFVYDDNSLIRDYCSDLCAYNNMLNWIGNDDRSTFTLLVTMQNHGGYSEPAEGFVSENYIDGDEEANTYFTLLSYSDAALERLINCLANKEEKYVVVFFGDHQPNIHVTWGNQGPGGDSWYVPYLIWANYEMPEGLANSDAGLTCLPYLGIDLLNVMGVDLPPYYQYIAEIRETIPVINASGYYSRSAGAFLPLDEIVDDAEGDALRRYQYLQYSAIFDGGNNSLVSEMLPNS